MGLLDAPFVAKESPGAKLRRLAAHARTADPYMLPTLAPARAWVASTAYLQGAVVTNGGNVYTCVIGGTSAASGGPTTTLAAIQADGTASWGYMGPTMALVTDPRAPVYSSSASSPGSLLNVYTPGTTPGYFTVYGANSANSSGSLTFTRFLQASGGSNAVGDARVSFWTDAPKFCIDVSGSSGGSNLTRIRIDGQFYSQGNLDVSAAVSFHTFDFTAAGGRRPRHIEIEFNRAAGSFRGLRTTGLDQVWPASSTDSVRALWISDSLFAGSAYGPFTQSTPQIAGAKLGWKDNWNLSIGGTGWLNPGTSSFYTFGQRVPQGLALSPDVWVFCGSINDITYTAAQVTAAALSAFQSIRAGGSRAPIVVLGLWSADYTGRTQAQLAATEAAVQAAVTAFADPLGKTFFIPITADPLLPWITTVNNNSAKTSTVNLTQIVANDGTHPTEYGTLYFADRIATAIRSNVLPALA